MEPELSCQRTRRHIVRAAEGGQEVIQRVLVGDVDRGQLQADFVLVSAEYIVVSNRQVEKAPRLDSLWVVVVLLGVRRWYLDQTRTQLSPKAVFIGLARYCLPYVHHRSRAHPVAVETRMELLIGG